jgi:4-carboxymuconolactone decarboxylase
MEDRYEKGLKQFLEMGGPDGLAMIENMKETSPDLARFVVEFAFGDIYPRPGLDLRTRMLATVAALTALGNAQPQLKANIGNALKVGCTREEILEVIIQMAVYAGFPAALNGAFAAREVFSELDG